MRRRAKAASRARWGIKRHTLHRQPCPMCRTRTLQRIKRGCKYTCRACGNWFPAARLFPTPRDRTRHDAHPPPRSRNRVHAPSHTAPDLGDNRGLSGQQLDRWGDLRRPLGEVGFSEAMLKGLDEVCG